MKPRITVITLGVDDLASAFRFYRDGLGLPSKGIIGEEFEHGAVAFFELEGGLKLALWPRRSIAHEMGMPLGEKSATELLLSHNVSSKEDVDRVAAEVERAGAKLLRQPHETFWGGYAAYFQDLDEHLWEIVWNPSWDPPQ